MKKLGQDPTYNCWRFWNRYKFPIFWWNSNYGHQRLFKKRYSFSGMRIAYYTTLLKKVNCLPRQFIYSVNRSNINTIYLSFISVYGLGIYSESKLNKKMEKS